VIHLASNSNSRAKLLEEFGVEFIQKASKYNEEELTTTVAKDFTYLASKGKLESAIWEFGLELPLLSADSVVAGAKGEILRKPKSVDDARRILGIQSGSQIAIITAMHLKAKNFYLSDISATYYRFTPFEQEDLEEYLQSGEWEGKAGGCMVEGFCKKYIVDVRGYESTARGLQMELLLNWIAYV
jgi:septum formation protein